MQHNQPWLLFWHIWCTVHMKLLIALMSHRLSRCWQESVLIGSLHLPVGVFPHIVPTGSSTCFLQSFLVQAEFLSGVLTVNSPQWAQPCSQKLSLAQSFRNVLWSLSEPTVTCCSLQGTWQTEAVKLWASLGDSSSWDHRFTGAVCLVTSRTRRESSPSGPTLQPSLRFECLCQYLQHQPWFNSQPGWQS